MQQASKLACPSVGVTIVTYNSAQYIRQCLEHVLRLDYPSIEIVVVDNASVDGTCDLLAAFAGRIKVIQNARNNGFAGGQNQAIGATNADWTLALNPDVRLEPDFVSKLIDAADGDDKIGTVCGKLLAMMPDFQMPARPSLDSTGIYMSSGFRHFDRGSRVPDTGQFDRREYVFGATGAAALYRRTMIEDISLDGEFFDEDFFAYREDADVAWRAQLLGWKCLYVPEARAFHVRSVLPSNRRSLSAFINMHSVKNRFLLRIKNTTGPLYRKHWLPVTLRDLIVIGGCLVYEFGSLRAFPIVLRKFRATWRKRRAILAKRRVSDDYIGAWFRDTPVSFPAAVPIRAEGEKTASR